MGFGCDGVPIDGKLLIGGLVTVDPSARRLRIRLQVG